MNKLEIVNDLIANGYHLFNETPEHFANRFDEATLAYVREKFLNYKKKN